MFFEKIKEFFQRIFWKKPYPNPNRKPINLPAIEDKSPDKIIGMLRDDIPIWAWFDAMQATNEDGSWNIDALCALEKGHFDGFYMYRKEGDLLCKYDAYFFNNDDKFYLKLQEVREFKNSNVLELCNTDFKNARELFYDVEGLTDEQQCYIHDLTQEEMKEYLSHNIVLYVSEEHFKKEEEAN